eukprot:6229436-Pyramimonas_sp.AAC.1
MGFLEADHLRRPLAHDGQFRRVRGGHLHLRHYPGEGSWAYSVLINGNLKARVTSHECGERSCRIDLACRSSDNQKCVKSILFSHLPPDDRFEDGVAEAVALGKSIPRDSALIWAGDMNADKFKPWQNRWKLFLNTAFSLGLKVEAPTFRESDEELHCTRRPDGAQQAANAWIDHIAIPSAMTAYTYVQWRGCPGDHACIFTNCLLEVRRPRTRTATCWRPTENIQIFNVAGRLHPPICELVRCDDMQRYDSCRLVYHEANEEEEKDIEVWESRLADVVKATEDKTPSRVRRLVSEPLWIKELRRRVRCELSDMSRIEKQKDLYRGLRILRKDLADRRQAQSWRFGAKVWRSAKGLAPVQGLLEDLPRGTDSPAVIIIDPVRCARMAFSEYYSRWNLPAAEISDELALLRQMGMLRNHGVPL